MAQRPLEPWQVLAYGGDESAEAAFEYYRERGWPVDDNTYPNRTVCEVRLYAFIAGYRLAERRAGAK